LDGGIKEARKFVLLTLESKFKAALDNKLVRDYKSEIHEFAQANKKTLSYKVIKEVGEEHFKTFVSQIIYDGKVLAEGEGRSKKASEQEAAKKALEKL
jgi:ribonuclease-3